MGVGCLTNTDAQCAAMSTPLDAGAASIAVSTLLNPAISSTTDPTETSQGTSTTHSLSTTAASATCSTSTSKHPSTEKAAADNADDDELRRALGKLSVDDKPTLLRRDSQLSVELESVSLGALDSDPTSLLSDEINKDRDRPLTTESSESSGMHAIDMTTMKNGTTGMTTSTIGWSPFGPSLPSLGQGRTNGLGRDIGTVNFGLTGQSLTDTMSTRNSDQLFASGLHLPFISSEVGSSLTSFTNGFDGFGTATASGTIGSNNASLARDLNAVSSVLTHSGLEEAMSHAASTDPHAATANIPCPQFQQGLCMRGELCPYSHQKLSSTGVDFGLSMLGNSTSNQATSLLTPNVTSTTGKGITSPNASSSSLVGTAPSTATQSRQASPGGGVVGATLAQPQPQMFTAVNMPQQIIPQMNANMAAVYPFGVMPAFNTPFYPTYPFSPMYAAAAAAAMAAAAANPSFGYGVNGFPRTPNSTNMGLPQNHAMSMAAAAAAVNYTGFPMHPSLTPVGGRPMPGPVNGVHDAAVRPSGVGNMAKPGNIGGSGGGGKRQNAGHGQEMNRYANLSLEDVAGEIYNLCKDQYGCRFLQQKLDEQKRKNINMIFDEVSDHVVELMTDPFGNYLCQKLIEFCTDEQRTVIVERVSPELLNISLNMHGTRAVQKMIEFLSNPQQIRVVVAALKPNVVTLIKDLNGNHVIQKCLNRLLSIDNQFIYDAVAEHCVEVSTHRHGCCVLQRCIDHASDKQRVQLANEITKHAHTLVQDPFGNYVVQYVLDLKDQRFTDNIIRRFIGHVTALSVQKFSSNVIEKCIRMAQQDTRKYLISELLNRDRLDKLLRDPYANYVVQTALDFADPVQRTQLVECIRPLLHAVRNTPYGKRIQSKLQRDPIVTSSASSNVNNTGSHTSSTSSSAGANMEGGRVNGSKSDDAGLSTINTTTTHPTNNRAPSLAPIGSSQPTPNRTHSTPTMSTFQFGFANTTGLHDTDASASSLSTNTMPPSPNNLTAAALWWQPS